MGNSLNVNAWATVAASNDGADFTIGTVANTSLPNTVDDWTRGIMASVKRYVLDTDGGITSAGTADALTITTNRVISSGHQAAGFSVRFKAGNTNTGAATVNVDALGAVAIKRLNGDALSAGDIIAGGIYDLAFDGTNYKLLGAGTGSGVYGTLSGDNTWSGTNSFTGSVTVGDGSGDVVVIKGTTLNSSVSALFNSASVSAYATAIMNGASQLSGTSALATTDRIYVRDASDSTLKYMVLSDFLQSMLKLLSAGATMPAPDGSATWGGQRALLQNVSDSVWHYSEIS